METYRLNSRLVENNKEYLIQTTNDAGLGSVSSEVFVNGRLADSVSLPHPERIKPEEVLSLVKATHGEKKDEVESFLKAYREVMVSGSSEMMYHLGVAFFYKCFYGEARDLFAAAVGLNAGYHEAFNILGQAELALGEAGKAVLAAEEAVRLKQQYADYRNNLGEALMATRNLKRAQEEFDRAIEENLYYSDAYFNYGLVVSLEALDDKNTTVKPNLISRAVDYFTKASLTCGDYRTGAFERGLEALKAQDVKQAFKLLREVRQEKKLQHGRRYAPYHMKYALYPQWITEKAVEERIGFLQNEISKNPTYVDLYIELSRCYLEHARILWKKGIDNYKKTLEINPHLDNLNAYLNEAEDAYESLNGVIRHVTEQE